MGLAHKLLLSSSYPKCDYEFESYLDNQCKADRKKQGRQPYELNVRTIIGFREIGQGHSGIENVLRCMNIHPISNSAFTSLNGQVGNAYEKASSEIMLKGVADVRRIHPVTDPSKNPHPTCRVSMDGSWQKRGHTFLHGMVTTIGERKCIGVHTSTKYYRQCRIWQQKKDSPEYELWKAVHKLV